MLRPVVLAACLAALACGDDPPRDELGQKSTPVKLGEPCATSADAQGDCERGFTCEMLAPGRNACTKECSTDEECGTTRGHQNRCQVGGCRVGCTIHVANDCPTDFACYNFVGGEACWPDCRKFAGYCKGSTSCDLQHGTCNRVGAAKHYEACTTNVLCQAGLECLTRIGTTGSVCLQQCGDGLPACPGTDTCSGALSDGSQFCARPCSPQVPSCPLGMGCWAMIDETTFFCMP